MIFWEKPVSTFPNHALKRDRNEMVERDQTDQKHNSEAEAPADQLLLDRQQRLGRVRGSDVVLNIRLRHGINLFTSACERRLEAAEEQPGDQEPDPDHETEQADEIDRSQLPEALLPELAEVGEHADREEGQDEEDHPEDVGLSGCGGKRLSDLGRRADRKPQRHGKDEDKAQDELRKALPDFDRL